VCEGETFFFPLYVTSALINFLPEINNNHQNNSDNLLKKLKGHPQPTNDEGGGRMENEISVVTAVSRK